MADQVPLAGSYSSAPAMLPAVAWPPATSTLPLGSRAAMCSSRVDAMLPVAVQAFVAGS